jgi:AcrR family transcriptional regulator
MGACDDRRAKDTLQFVLPLVNLVAAYNVVNVWMGSYSSFMSEAGKPYHHGDLRAALLARAEYKLATEGAHSLSLRELAREVGVSHGAPRQHFRNKQLLLDVLAEVGFGRLGQELSAAMAEGDGSFIESLTTFAQTYVRFVSRHPALLELMFASLHRPGADPTLRQANDRAFAAPTTLIAKRSDQWRDHRR